MGKLKVIVNHSSDAESPEVDGWPIDTREGEGVEQVTVYRGNRAYVILLGENVEVETWSAYENGDLGRVLNVTEIPAVTSEEQLEFPFVNDL